MRCSPLDAFGTGMDDDTAVLAVPAPRPDGEGITVLVTVWHRIETAGCS